MPDIFEKINKQIDDEKKDLKRAARAGIIIFERGSKRPFSDKLLEAALLLGYKSEYHMIRSVLFTFFHFFGFIVFVLYFQSFYAHSFSNCENFYPDKFNVSAFLQSINKT